MPGHGPVLVRFVLVLGLNHYRIFVRHFHFDLIRLELLHIQLETERSHVAALSLRWWIENVAKTPYELVRVNRHIETEPVVTESEVERSPVAGTSGPADTAVSRTVTVSVVPPEFHFDAVVVHLTLKSVV